MSKKNNKFKYVIIEEGLIKNVNSVKKRIIAVCKYKSIAEQLIEKFNSENDTRVYIKAIPYITENKDLSTIKDKIKEFLKKNN